MSFHLTTPQRIEAGVLEFRQDDTVGDGVRSHCAAFTFSTDATRTANDEKR